MLNKKISKTLIYILILISGHTDYTQGFSEVSELNSELVFYNDGESIFTNVQGSIQKSDFKMKSIRIKKVINGSIYFESLDHDIYVTEPGSKFIKKIDVTMDKPVDIKRGLKREIMDVDNTGKIFLFKHNLVGKFKGQTSIIKTNLSKSERYYSVSSDKNNIYVGTAVNGLYTSSLSSNGYLHFKSQNAGLPYIPYDNQLKFYEEIHAIHLNAEGTLLVGTGIQGGIYIKPINSNTFKNINWPQKWENTDIYLITSGKNGVIWVSCNQGIVEYIPGNHGYTFKTYAWKEFHYNYNSFIVQKKDDPQLYGYYQNRIEDIPPEKKARMEKAASKRLFYSSPYNLIRKSAEVEALIKSPNFDGIVLDVKDDRGQVLYNSNVSFVRDIGALHPVMNLPRFIELVHAHRKYIAVRIVVYKDPVLFEYENFAIWDKNLNQPWVGNAKERWIDPFNPALASKYYIPLIRELEQMGVDEIQLDYIRFPAEGLLDKCEFRFKKNDKYFTEAIEDFLYSIRQATELPVSVDIYGYQGLYRTPGAIGQDMDVFGDYADIISPMLYSSHFGDLYLTDTKKEDRIFRLIQHSIRRAEYIANSQYLIRPYLQAFPMKSAIWGYGDWYFLDQIKASNTENGSGYSFWGSIENMRAVDLAVDSSQ